MRKIVMIAAVFSLGGLWLSALGAENARLQPLKPGLAQRISAEQARVGPRTRAFVAQEASKIAANGGFSQVQIRADLEGADLGATSGGDIDALVQMVMLQAAVDAENDLRDQIAVMQSTMSQKKAAREAAGGARQGEMTAKSQTASEFSRRSPAGPIVAPTYALDSVRSLGELDNRIAADQNDLDSLGDLSQSQQMQLQLIMDRRTKAITLLSNLMKAAAETSTAITGNLK